MIKKIDNVVNRVCSAFGVVSAICLVGVIILVTIDVFARKFFQATVPGAYEITERTLMCMVFAGLSYTEAARGHIAVTMLLSAFNRTAKFVIYAIMQLAGSVISFYLAYAAYTQTGVSFKTHTTTTVLLIPLYPFYAFETLCVAVFALVLLWYFIKSIIAIKNDSIADEIQSAWS